MLGPSVKPLPPLWHSLWRNWKLPLNGCWTRKWILADWQRSRGLQRLKVPTWFLRIAKKERKGGRDCINVPNEEETFLCSPSFKHQSPCWRPSMRHRFIGNWASFILLLMVWLGGYFLLLRLPGNQRQGRRGKEEKVISQLVFCQSNAEKLHVLTIWNVSSYHNDVFVWKGVAETALNTKRQCMRTG